MDIQTEILDKLNEEQIRPVLQTEGAVLVLAGAGSGKTRVLTSRIAYLIEEKQVPPEAVLAITFTNKAANEMKERLEKITDVSKMWVCTIHSMCVRILRMFADEAGVGKNFSIYSETERANIIKKSFHECDFDDETLLKNAKWHIANAKMLGLSPEEYLNEEAGEPSIEDIVKIYARYDKHLKDNNALDFDDLLNHTRLLLKNNEEVREFLSGRFRYVLVDEFQDTNRVQYEIVRYLCSVHGNVFVVGDDDQSIYGWRGAKIENILHFERYFKDAKIFKLERNYRSTKKILDVANAVIANNGRRKQKRLWTENADGDKVEVFEAEEESGEARYAAQVVAGLVRKGYRYSDIAILMRLNALTRSFEQEFLSDSVPFKVFGGFKFYERKEIKDMLAYLRAVNNPMDSEAIVRIINVPKRGIGAKTVQVLEDYALQTDGSVYDALLDIDEIGISGATRQKLDAFTAQLKGWVKEGAFLPVVDLVKNIVAQTGIRAAYQDGSDEGDNKVANLDEFVASVEEYCKLNPEATLADYLNQVTLSSDTDDMDDGNYVTLATIHAVKGLEFKAVIVCGLEDNILPSTRSHDNDDTLEEERRLMYVAVTRAKQRLYLTRSKSRYLYGRREPTLRSRFLKELSSVVELPQAKPAQRGCYSDEDPDFYGNATYGAGRFSGGKSYGGYGSSYGGSSYGNSRGSSYGGGYGSTYGGKTYGSSTYTSEKPTSSPVRTTTYGSGTYGSASYGAKPAAANHTGTSGAAAYAFGGGAKPTGTKDVSAFKEGVRVSHPKFGQGTIVGVRGTAANTIVNVAFDGLGVKQLSAALAPLTIVK